MSHLIFKSQGILHMIPSDKYTISHFEGIINIEHVTEEYSFQDCKEIQGFDTTIEAVTMYHSLLGGKDSK